MPQPTNIAVGKRRYGGQDPRKGLPVAVTGANTAAGDAVNYTANAGEVTRPAADAAFVGKLLNREGDNVGTLQFGDVQIYRRTGAISAGVQTLAADGTGGVKTASGAGTKCHVLGTSTENGTNYVALIVIG